MLDEGSEASAPEPRDAPTDHSARSFGDLLAMAMHDLRTPLVVVSGHAHLLREQRTEMSMSEQRDSLDAIVRQTSRLSRIVEDLLTLSRANDGNEDVGARPVDLRDSLDVVVDDCGLRDVVAETLGSDAWVLADRIRVERILTNLLMNSSVHGAPPIEVEGATNGPRYRLRVRDHGPGVPPAAVATLFDMFTRASDATHGRRTGFGLGLAIARSLAVTQGGDVSYDGDAAGAVFVLELPATSAATISR